jgi:hypothetical protein
MQKVLLILSLVIIINIECFIFNINKNNYIQKLNAKLNAKTFKMLNFDSICYEEDDRRRRRNNKFDKIDFINDRVEEDDDDKPLYTLIWYDCDQCKKLLDEMDSLNLKKLYINGGYYFYDITDNNSEFNKPLFYKDDLFIGDELYEIYSEIYSNS